MKNQKEIACRSFRWHVKRISSIGSKRNMDIHDESVGRRSIASLRVISAVAEANSYTPVKSTSTPFLPELRTSPCLIHKRLEQTRHLTLYQLQCKHRLDNRNDLLYSTTCHGGHNNMSVLARWSPANSLQEESKLETERDMAFQREMQAGRSQVYSLPVLPKEKISPEDFVSNWLQYGSEPQGKSHFPNISQVKTNANVDIDTGKLGRKKQIESPVKVISMGLGSR